MFDVSPRHDEPVGGDRGPEAFMSETAEEADRILDGDPELTSAAHAEIARAVDQLWRRYALA